MNAIIPLFQTPHVILRDLERRLRAMYPPVGFSAKQFKLLPDFASLSSLLPESACGGMDLVRLNHFGIHFPYEQREEREQRLNTFSNEGQLMRSVSIGSDTKYGPSIQVNTFVRLTKSHDPDPLWLELGVDTCSFPYIHADFVLPRDSGGFDSWFDQYVSRSKPASAYDSMESNQVLFVKCMGVNSPLSQYSITSRDGLVSWHFRTSDRDLSPLDWQAQIGAR